MPYATVADAELIYGSEKIAVVCDRNLDGTVDASSFEQHLLLASEKMDGYLLGVYDLPFENPPPYFKQVCVDLAIYKAANGPPRASTAMKDAYDEAIKYLEALRRNKQKPKTGTDSTDPSKAHSPETITAKQQTSLVACGARTFTRKSTRGI